MRTKAAPWLTVCIALPLIGLIATPLFGLFGAITPNEFIHAISHETFTSALLLSLKTSLCSLVIILLLGTPTAWLIAGLPTPIRVRLVSLIELPIVMPPAVVGLGLLLCFGNASIMGRVTASLGFTVPFTLLAVVIAQVVIAAPFFVSAAVSAFANVSDDLLLVSRTLGFGRWTTLCKVLIPISLPNLLSGAALAWARALGEFGATLLFAGSLKGVTMTMPLAIYSALETDISVAIALAIALLMMALTLLVALRATPVLIAFILRRWQSRERVSV